MTQPIIVALAALPLDEVFQLALHKKRYLKA